MDPALECHADGLGVQVVRQHDDRGVEILTREGLAEVGRRGYSAVGQWSQGRRVGIRHYSELHPRMRAQHRKMSGTESADTD